MKTMVYPFFIISAPHILWQGDLGWCVFYHNMRHDQCLLYQRCTIEEACAVLMEWYESELDEITKKTIPASHK